MYIEATSTFMAMAASLAVIWAPASAQPVVGSIEHVLEPGKPIASVVEPAAPAAGSQTPAASHNVISQPPVCRIRTNDECHQTAAACLTARGVGGLYKVASGREGATVVLRVQEGMSEAEERHARACATDLKQCLSGNC